MDDQRFDDVLKNKVGTYEDNDFDPAALASLHQKLGAVSVWPWYTQYRTELLVGSGLLISTLIIVWSQWFIYNNNQTLLSEHEILLQKQQNLIGNLQNEIGTLKNVPPDTVRIIEIRERPSYEYAFLLHRINLLEASKNEQTSEGKNGNDFTGLQMEQDENSELSDTPLNFGLINPNTNSFSSRLNPRENNERSLRAEPTLEMNLNSTKAQQLSVNTLRDLEKHYQKGIGIRVGPLVDVSKGLYSSGKGKLDLAGGLLADFILSPSFSLESGAKIRKRVYEVLRHDLSGIDPPRVDSSLGTLNNVDVDSWIIEIPLNLKYRYPVSLKTHWVIGAGFSSLIYTKQILEYGYRVDTNPSVSLISSNEESQVKAYPGTVNFSIGVSNQLRKKKTFETSVFYQHGLGKIGVEQNKLNFFGVRGVYWFTLR